MDKLIEHYGVMLGESTIRRITEGHARQILERANLARANRAVSEAKPPESSPVLIVEMDGGMVPIVEPDITRTDKRKGKQLQWKEAKICLAHAQGSRTLAYGGTLQGDVDTAGQQLLDCARRAGLGKQTHVHAVGDGAPWIAEQVEQQFGAQGGYLIDFYHVCDYLSAAAKALVSEAAAQKPWLEEQKTRLKTGRSGELLQLLRTHVEASHVTDADAPIRQCYRYLSNRTEQLNYAGALAQDLPIGSGEIESAHRYVVQQRLKRPGAWWRVANAEPMLALRLNRANRQWDAYWTEELKQAA